MLTLLRWPRLYLVILLALACLYRYGPSRTHPQWRWVTWGSAVAGAAWVVGSLVLSWYVANFGTYNATYGSLGAIIGFMVWMWLSTIIVLVGGEINAETEHQTAKDTTQGRRKPMGARGATEQELAALVERGHVLIPALLTSHEVHQLRVEFEQLLHDSLTGLPTLPVMIERSRALFKERGELVVLYLNFVRYSKVEEIYGWEKLDAVLETTASAVREFLNEASSASRLMVCFTHDDDFILFHVTSKGQ